MRHYVAGLPQIIQSQRAVLAAAITLGACTRGHLKVAIAHDAAFLQDDPHFGDGVCMLLGHEANSRVAIVSIALAVHNGTPMRKFVHRPGGQPATPVEELALLISHSLPHVRLVIENTAMQRDVMAARDDLERIQLQVFYGAHGLLCTFDTAPASPGP